MCAVMVIRYFGENCIETTGDNADVLRHIMDGSDGTRKDTEDTTLVQIEETYYSGAAVRD